MAVATPQYLVTLADVKRPETSWVKITTITIISKFSHDVDTHKLRSRLQLLGPIKLSRAGGRPFVWGLNPTSFYNQVTLGYTDAYSTKSVKVFPNGSVQIAGCCDLYDCQRVMSQLLFIVKTVLEIDSMTIVGDIRVVMINTNFSLNYSINLMETTRLFAADKFFTSVTFDPDRYSAVKVKFKPGPDMKQVTVSMFGTGKIIITGAENLQASWVQRTRFFLFCLVSQVSHSVCHLVLQEIVFAYQKVVDHVEKHAKNIKVKPSLAPDMFDMMNGYHIEELVDHYKTKGVQGWLLTNTMARLKL